VDPIAEQPWGRCAGVLLCVFEKAVIHFDSLVSGEKIAVVDKYSTAVGRTLPNTLSIGVIVECTDGRYVRFRMEKLIVLRSQAYTEPTTQNYSQNGTFSH
jgi:hypothetical protein